MRDATHLYAIGIGSNRCSRHGRPQANVEAAIARLDRDFGLFDASRIVLNPAIGGAGRDFANAVAIIESALAPPELLAALKRIERDFGRRPGRRWSARILDLDILAWSGGSFQSRSLTIPHPRLCERPFALGLLASISPTWRLSASRTAKQMAHGLKGR